MKHGAMERDDQGEKKLPKTPRYFFARTRNARITYSNSVFLLSHLSHMAKIARGQPREPHPTNKKKERCDSPQSISRALQYDL